MLIVASFINLNWLHPVLLLFDFYFFLNFCFFFFFLFFFFIIFFFVASILLINHYYNMSILSIIGPTWILRLYWWTGNQKEWWIKVCPWCSDLFNFTSLLFACYFFLSWYSHFKWSWYCIRDSVVCWNIVGKLFDFFLSLLLTVIVFIMFSSMWTTQS